MSIENVVSGYTNPPRRTWADKVHDKYLSKPMTPGEKIVWALCAVMLVAANLV